jgi:uncharacterized metal-binding protein
MTVQCAMCGSYVCRGGNREAGPDFCPMLQDFPEISDLYGDDVSRDLLVNAALVEATGYGRWNRLKELGEFARLMGVSRIGIVHGPDMAWEAGEVSSYLRKEGLQPFLPPATDRCDPVGQAGFFHRKKTQMNVIAGMSVAGETLFLRATSTPTTCLIARDARLRHNPAAALYTSRSYSQEELHGHWPKEERPETCGGESELLAIAGQPQPIEPRSRLAEAMDVAHKLGASHLGVTFCVGFKEEAKTLTKVLEVNGFSVSSACCKTGATPKEDVGIRDDQKVRPGRPEMICNPVAQAELLNRDGVQFVFVLGQCVGHDAAVFRTVEAPAICLVVKDRVLAHNPVAALH